MSINPPGNSPPAFDPNDPVPGGKGPVTSGYKGDTPITGTPLPPDDPWYKMMMQLFPKADPNTIGVYAHKFRDTVMKMLSDEIGKLQQKAHEASQKLKQALTGDDNG
jgi:hypothetical protein